MIEKLRSKKAARFTAIILGFALVAMFSTIVFFAVLNTYQRHMAEVQISTKSAVHEDVVRVYTDCTKKLHWTVCLNSTSRAFDPEGKDINVQSAVDELRKLQLKRNTPADGK